jgi:hypothetical protein
MHKKIVLLIALVVAVLYLQGCEQAPNPPEESAKRLTKIKFLIAKAVHDESSTQNVRDYPNMSLSDLIGRFGETSEEALLELMKTIENELGSKLEVERGVPLTKEILAVAIEDLMATRPDIFREAETKWPAREITIKPGAQKLVDEDDSTGIKYPAETDQRQPDYSSPISHMLDMPVFPDPNSVADPNEAKRQASRKQALEYLASLKLQKETETGYKYSGYFGSDFVDSNFGKD